MVEAGFVNLGRERGGGRARAEPRPPDAAKDLLRGLRAARLAIMHADVAGKGFHAKLGEAFQCVRSCVYTNVTTQLELLGDEGIADQLRAGRAQREAPISSWPRGLKMEMFKRAEQDRLRALWNPSSEAATSGPSSSGGKGKKRKGPTSVQHKKDFKKECARQTGRIAAGELSSAEAAEEMCAAGFPITSSALRYQKGKHAGEEPRSVGSPTLLTAAEEEEVVDWVHVMRSFKHPVTKQALIDKVMLAMGDSAEERVKGGKLGKDWYNGFRRRHSDVLGTLASGTLESGRDEWSTSEQFREYFDALRDCIYEIGTATPSTAAAVSAGRHRSPPFSPRVTDSALRLPAASIALEPTCSGVPDILPSATKHLHRLCRGPAAPGRPSLNTTAISVSLRRRENPARLASISTQRLKRIRDTLCATHESRPLVPPQQPPLDATGPHPSLHGPQTPRCDSPPPASLLNQPAPGSLTFCTLGRSFPLRPSTWNVPAEDPPPQAIPPSRHRWNDGRRRRLHARAAHRRTPGGSVRVE